MFGESIIYYFGLLASLAFAFLVLSIIGGIVLSLLAYKANFFVFPRVTFFLLEKLRSVFRFAFSFFSRDRYLVERMAIKTLNHVYRKRYSTIPPSERMLIMPQCLRDLERRDLGRRRREHAVTLARADFSGRRGLGHDAAQARRLAGHDDHRPSARCDRTAVDPGHRIPHREVVEQESRA